MGELSPWHLLILAGVFVLLFGAKRLPDGARSLGRSLRIFKTEVKGLNEDDNATPTSGAAQSAALPPTPVPPAVQAPVAQPPVTQAAAAPAQDATPQPAAVADQHETR